jgi:aminopeptidase S
VSDSVTIGSLAVNLEIDHTYIGDLRIVVSHGGVEHVLHRNTGGGNDDIDETYQTSAFNGHEASGRWILHVVDGAARDVGTIVAWSLDVSTESNHGGGGNTPPESFPGQGGMDIPDNDATGITSEAGVPAGSTGTVSVALNITHTWRGDLAVTLRHGGQSWSLHNRAGGSADDLVSSTVLDPQPSNLGGTWTLHVSDHAGQDLGTLNSWSLTVQ